jgi:RHH-type proline utilization regulon transcriptional repressor/proline dehydrogenase/delta 1-pyrroline-5-carboxylate dehydrogenase
MSIHPLPVDPQREDPSDLARQAVDLAERLLIAARSQQQSAEREQSERLARMMDDPAGKELTIAMVDQAFRSHQPARIADQISHLLDEYGTPRYMDWWERTALTLGGVMGQYLPAVVVPPVIARLRQETRSVILPAEEGDLRRYLQKRRQSGTRLNLNQLGEAILGEAEAERRMNAYLALLARPDVEYISVKVSSIFSQINLVAYRQTVKLVKDQLRRLYRQALSHTYAHADGRQTPKFVNLDMEEYRDLHLTIDAFKETLDEEEFMNLSAGIVLQAYIPDSFPLQQDLTDWAIARRERQGAPIKIRIVKGANLAMERVDAAIHGWPQAPYTTKLQVDANFKRMVAYGCDPDRAPAVHLGIASHNLFDIAYGLILRARRGVEAYVEFEMLEGMANHQARAVQNEAGGLLLYAPVVKAEDFHSAIAYLVRRLDENTAPENFLHDLFGMEPGSAEWIAQRDQFLAACELVESVKATPNRTQDRRAEIHTGEDGGFFNEPDTDWSLPQNQQWITEIAATWRDRAPETIPLQIGGDFIETELLVDGVDPSRPGHVGYRHSLADAGLVDRALSAAVDAQPAWGSRPIRERKAILLAAADEFARRRGELIGSMMLDTGKSPAEADPEVSEGIDFARYYAHALDLGDAAANFRLQPLGVVVVTPPWNFPFAIPAGGVLAALMAGNAVILKPAPEAVLVGWQIVQALWAAGVPKEILQFVPAPDNEIGRQLIVDPRTAAVILTGSIETARLFQGWRPDLRLFAETSGKDAIIVTALADRDQAIKDMVRSAFGHNGQKCSAASLAILEAEVYDDPSFRRQLQDAAASLTVGPVWDLASVVTPLTQPPSEKLCRALTSLEPGESWLLEPRPVPLGEEVADPCAHPLWSPGIKLGVAPGSFFHRTECFGPVLGLMRAEDLDDAIDIANGVEFGLTGGIHTLDDREIERWMERIEVGNGYVNRHITGAIVQRQPFGGWKASVVGPGAKAGGPNYVLQFGTWIAEGLPTQQARPAPAVATILARLERLLDESGVETLRAAAGSYAWAWYDHFSEVHDPSAVLGERNIFRYRPLSGLLVRAEGDADPLALAQTILAAVTCGSPLTLSLGAGMDAWLPLVKAPTIQVIVEEESGLIARLQAGKAPYDRLRAVAPLSESLRRTLNDARINVVDAPVIANGRLELRYYLREQAISQTVHRYGNVLGAYRGLVTGD